VGWRLVPTPGAGLALQGQWKVRDAAAGRTLVEMMEAIASQEQQQPQLQLDEENRNVTAVLHTAALGMWQAECMGPFVLRHHHDFQHLHCDILERRPHQATHAKFVVWFLQVASP